MMTGQLQWQKVWLAQHKVDFRKGHNGLLAEAYKMSLDPFLGDLIIFVGRNRRHLKVLYADSTGLWVSSKKFTLASIKTKIEFLLDPSCKSILQSELSMLLSGTEYTVKRRVPTYEKAVDV